MSRQQAKRAMDEDDRNERIVEVLEGVTAAKKTAESIFGEPTTEQVFMTFDLVIDDTDSVEEAELAVRDLKEAVKVAKEIFGDNPTEEQIVGVFYRAFPDYVTQ